jgi:hypothetical protein
MNLFRSEEHARSWSAYDAGSQESIMPVGDWAYVFSGSMCRERLGADVLSRRGDYMIEIWQRLQELGKEGPFWKPQ